MRPSHDAWAGLYRRCLSAMAAGLREEGAQDAKSAKLSRKGGAPIFSPSRLLAALCRVAPQFKVVPAILQYLMSVQAAAAARVSPH